MKHSDQRICSSLAGYVWKLKDEGREFDVGKRSRFWKIWFRKKGFGFGFEKIGTKALKWSHISPNPARKSQISSLWEDAKLSPIYP